MRKILAVALLAALAPLSIAHAAPKPTPTKMAMKMPMKGKMTGGKMTGGKMSGKKMPMTKKSTKKMPAKKTMPMRDSKTGRFMKKPTPAPTKK